MDGYFSLSLSITILCFFNIPSTKPSDFILSSLLSSLLSSPFSNFSSIFNLSSSCVNKHVLLLTKN